MDTKDILYMETETQPGDYDRVVDQLRVAAVGSGQTEAHRQWIRAGTQC